MNNRQAKVAALCDGIRTSKEIAELCKDKQKYVQEVMLKFDLPRLRRDAKNGKKNHQYKHGRMIDRDGYVLVSAPEGHPYARLRKNRNTGIIYEHRLVMEQKLDRYLLPQETVDHVDGLRLHNSPLNLRLFDSNAEHLKATITGQIPQWSQEAMRKQRLSKRESATHPRIDTYDRKKKSGDARLLQILLAALKLGINSPFLLGTHHLLERAGISDFSHSNLGHELDLLYQRYA
jgi:hypothetical protein